MLTRQICASKAVGPQTRALTYSILRTALDWNTQNDITSILCEGQGMFLQAPESGGQGTAIDAGDGRQRRYMAPADVAEDNLESTRSHGAAARTAAASSCFVAVKLGSRMPGSGRLPACANSG